MSDSSYEVRPYQAGDEHGLIALWNTVFGEGASGFTPRTLAQWRWLWADNPMGRQVMVAVAASGQVIAHYGALPARIACGGAIHVSAQMIDSMVHPEWRRGLQREGVFLRTARAFFDAWAHLPENAVHYGFPNRRVYPIGRRYLKYTPFIEPVPVVFRNFFQDEDDDAVGREHADAGRAEEIASFGGEPGGGATVGGATVGGATVGGEIDALWKRLAPKYPFAHVRDRTHLEWRYDRCPWLPYRRFLLRGRGGELRGWFVVRERWQGLPILALTDLLVDPDDDAAVALALRAATRHARATGHARIEGWLPERHSTFRHALAARFRTEPGLYVMCMNLFLPDVSREQALEQCYYTIGDSDVW